jgi:hypothetical protein
MLLRRQRSCSTLPSGQPRRTHEARRAVRPAGPVAHVITSSRVCQVSGRPRSSATRRWPVCDTIVCDRAARILIPRRPRCNHPPVAVYEFSVRMCEAGERRQQKEASPWVRNGRKTTSPFALPPLTPTLSPEYRGEGVIFRRYRLRMVTCKRAPKHLSHPCLSQCQQTARIPRS